MSIIDDIANHLADMPGQTLPVYQMQFPPDVINCIAVFPTGGGVGGNIGSKPSQMTDNAGGVAYMDYPGVQVQVRHGDPFNAFKVCEDIRQWLDENCPTGYLRCDTNRSIPDDLTNAADLSMAGGPAFRFSVDFSFIKVR
jgi:hypothetical protein